MHAIAQLVDISLNVTKIYYDYFYAVNETNLIDYKQFHA